MKKEKKYLIYGIALVLVTLIGVSLSYFVAYIEGDKKQIGVSTADLKIIFNNGEAISGENIKPGWSITKTFSIENRSDDVFKYNISIEDLVNTFVTTGYLQYKITSSNGYNMTEYKDIPKSLEPMDRLLAFNIEIPQGVIQEYTIEMVYRSDDEVDQSKDMGKTLSGLLYISEDKEPTLAEHIINTYTVNNQIDYNPIYKMETGDNNFKEGTLYFTNLTEDGSNVYFYSGDVANNWVKFGKYKTDWYLCIKIERYDSSSDYYTVNLPTCPEGYTGTKLATAGDDIYWRIIRTNEDGGVRLLYSGTSPDTTKGTIGLSNFNSSFDDPMYVGYMYGSSGTLANNRTNENSSNVKQVLESWYRYNLYNTEYDKSISKSAIYCNDRSVGDGTYSLTDYFKFGSRARSFGGILSYKCGSHVLYNLNETNSPSKFLSSTLFETSQAIEDKFSVSTTDGGNGKLTYPIGLMTYDELSYAKAMGNINKFTRAGALDNTWVVMNSNCEEIVDYIILNEENNKYASNYWWTISPNDCRYGLCSQSSSDGTDIFSKVSLNVRPVISLDKCAMYSSGDGTADNPYIVNVGKCKEYNYPEYNYVDPEPQVYFNGQV